jgi:trk system potassium uptake protein TrkH
LWALKKREIYPFGGAMIFSTVIWLIASALSALPFYFSGDLSYIDGYFEAMSGYTTTGFSMYIPT